MVSRVLVCSGCLWRLEKGFLSQAVCSGAQLALRVTEARERLLAVVLFQCFTDTAHSFS